MSFNPTATPNRRTIRGCSHCGGGGGCWFYLKRIPQRPSATPLTPSYCKGNSLGGNPKARPPFEDPLSRKQYSSDTSKQKGTPRSLSLLNHQKFLPKVGIKAFFPVPVMTDSHHRAFRLARPRIGNPDDSGLPAFPALSVSTAQWLGTTCQDLFWSLLE